MELFEIQKAKDQLSIVVERLERIANSVSTPLVPPHERPLVKSEVAPKPMMEPSAPSTSKPKVDSSKAVVDPLLDFILDDLRSSPIYQARQLEQDSLVPVTPEQSCGQPHTPASDS